MIERLAELNRVLLAATAIAQPGQSITQASVLRQCESTVIESMMPDHRLSINFAGTVGLVATKADRIEVTEMGKEFLALNPEHTYDLTADQKRMLIRNQYLSGINRLGTLQVLKCFTKEYDAQTFRWSESDSQPMLGDRLLIEHLIQLGVLQRRESFLEVNTEYVDAVATLLTDGKGWTPKDIEEYYREKREIGDIAEELMFAYEKERVRRAGGKVECLCINHVSKLRPDVGYDMESFNGQNPGMVHDRFIEVKGARGVHTRFFMSDNEIKVAKKLKDRYWIYFVGGIEKRMRTAKNKPLLFQNPAESILNNPKYKKTPQGVLVEEIV